MSRHLFFKQVQRLIFRRIGIFPEICPVTLSIIDIVILAFLVTSFVVLFGRIVPSGVFSYDEADYMFAVSRGFSGNYVDTQTTSLLTYVKKGLGEALDSNRRTSLSEYIRESGDIAFYRHFHGPLYFYWLIVFKKFFGDAELTMRWASLTCLIFSFVAMYLGCFLLLKENARIPATLATVLLLFSPSNISTSIQITPHSLYVLIVICGLFLMASMIYKNDLKYLYFCIYTVCLAFLTIEYAPLLLITLIICVALNHKNLLRNWPWQLSAKQLLKITAIFLFIFAIIWPAGLFKLTIVKNYLFYLHAMLVKGYSPLTLSEVWGWRIISSPIEYILIFFSSVLFIFNLLKYKIYQELIPFYIYTILFLLTIFGNTSPNSTYISSLLPPVYAISGVVLGQFVNSRKLLFKVGTVVFFAIALSSSNYIFYLSNQIHEDQKDHLSSLVSYFMKKGTFEERLLVPWDYVPTIHYYFPQLEISSYTEELRSDIIISRFLAEKFDGLLYKAESQDALLAKLEQVLPVQVCDTIVHERTSKIAYCQRIIKERIQTTFE